MNFSSLNKNVKKQIIEDNLLEYEKTLYELLIKLAIDPDSFDIDTYDENSYEVKEDDMTRKNLLSSLTKAVNDFGIILNELRLTEESNEV